MTAMMKLLTGLVCVSICGLCVYFLVINQSGNTVRSFYLTEPSIDDGNITVTVWNSTDPDISEIYVGFNVNDGGGAIHNDSYTRCVGFLSNDTSVDWIAYSDNDSDGKISINDTFAFSRSIFQDQSIQNAYLTDGYYSIAFSNEGKERYLAIIIIDASEI